jgi:hypothetical protein
MSHKEILLNLKDLFKRAETLNWNHHKKEFKEFGSVNDLFKKFNSELESLNLEDKDGTINFIVKYSDFLLKLLVTFLDSDIDNKEKRREEFNKAFNLSGFATEINIANKKKEECPNQKSFEGMTNDKEDEELAKHIEEILAEIGEEKIANFFVSKPKGIKIPTNEEKEIKRKDKKEEVDSTTKDKKYSFEEGLKNIRKEIETKIKECNLTPESISSVFENYKKIFSENIKEFLNPESKLQPISVNAYGFIGQTELSKKFLTLVPEKNSSLDNDIQTKINVSIKLELNMDGSFSFKDILIMEISLRDENQELLYFDRFPISGLAIKIIGNNFIFDHRRSTNQKINDVLHINTSIINSLKLLGEIDFENEERKKMILFVEKFRNLDKI